MLELFDLFYIQGKNLNSDLLNANKFNSVQFSGEYQAGSLLGCNVVESGR
jgi:hypothetical protein